VFADALRKRSDIPESAAVRPATTRLNILGDLQVALHYHPVRQLQQQDDEYQQAAIHVQIEFSDLDVIITAGVGKIAGWEEQQNQPQQQQHAARRVSFSSIARTSPS